MNSAVVTADLRMTYPNGREVLRGVTLDVPQGQFVSLLGTNGAGKSTLLRTLVKLHEPTSGSIHLHGDDVVAAHGRTLNAIRQQVGFVFQSFHLSNYRTAFANVVSGAASTRGSHNVLPMLSPKDVREEAMDCLHRVGMREYADTRVDKLSGGQRQRVAIARMLIQKPRMVFADEPVASLDPHASIEVMKLLTKIARQDGMTVIAALHQLDLAERFTERLIGLDRGVIVIDGPADRSTLDSLTDMYARRGGDRVDDPH